MFTAVFAPGVPGQGTNGKAAGSYRATAERVGRALAGGDRLSFGREWWPGELAPDFVGAWYGWSGDHGDLSGVVFRPVFQGQTLVAVILRFGPGD